MKVTDIPKISRLSTAEKILFVEDVWDSIYSKERIPMPEPHKAELDRRLAKYRNRSGGLLSLKELQARIEKRK